LKEKKVVRAALKERVLNGQEPFAWLDSGATSTFIAPHDKKHLQSTGKPSTKRVKMPNGQMEAAGEQMKMNNGLRHPANSADTIPSLKTSLVSNSKLADAGYITVYDENEVNVYDSKDTAIKPTKAAIMTGWRCKQTGLWRFPLKSEIKDEKMDTKVLNENETKIITSEIASNVYDLPSTEHAIRYLHAAAGFPTKPTWIKAINAGFFTSWPMLTTRNVNKYFPESEETQKGHMRQKKAGVRRTNRRIRMVLEGNELEFDKIETDIKELQRKREDIMIKVYNCTESVFTDQTGQFPVTSNRGNKYIMVLCEIDGNQILAEPMQNRSEGSLILTRQKLMNRLKQSGIYPKMQYVDNEASAAFKQSIKDDKMDYQLITPHMHRANIAEKAIQTFKNHFKSILSGVDDSFPVQLWDRLIPQAEMTLNMLRPSNVSPKISAYMYAHGNHDFNAHPLAPMGCAVQIYVRPENRKTWDVNSIDGYYIGTSFEHYRNYTIWCIDTQAERNSDTVWFKHKYLTNPKLTAADVIVNAANDLNEAIRTNPPSKLPSKSKNDLTKLAEIFTQAAIKYSNKEASKKASLPGVDRRTPGVPAPTPGVTTRSQTQAKATMPTRRSERSITTEAMLSAIEMSSIPLRTQRLASRKFPLAMLCEIAGAVLDPKTGELMDS
jgi:hypothetical protein